MTIDVTETLSESVERTLSASGGVLFAALLIVGLANRVVGDTFVAGLVRFAMDQTQYTVGDLERELLERGYEPVAFALKDILSSGLDVGFPVAVALVLLVPLVAEFVRVVGVRSIAAEPHEGYPTDAVADGLSVAYLRSLIAGMVAALLVFVGSLLLVIPGLVLAIMFLFVRQSVVLGDTGAFEALSHSTGVVKRNPLAVLALVAIMILLFFPIMFMAGMIPVGIVTTAVRALVTVFLVSMVTSAYLQASPEV